LFVWIEILQRWSGPLPVHCLLVLLVAAGMWNDLLWIERIANVDGTHPAGEIRDEHHAIVVDGREVLVRGVRAEPSAAVA
jgi:hypothetical protein